MPAVQIQIQASWLKVYARSDAGSGGIVAHPSLCTWGKTLRAQFKVDNMRLLSRAGGDEGTNHIVQAMTLHLTQLAETTVINTRTMQANHGKLTSKLEEMGRRLDGALAGSSPHALAASASRSASGTTSGGAAAASAAAPPTSALEVAMDTSAAGDAAGVGRGGDLATIQRVWMPTTGSVGS